MVKTRARAGDDMFITCNVVSVPTKITKLGENLICIRKSFQGTSCKTQKKYDCGFGEHILEDYNSEIVSTAKNRVVLRREIRRFLRSRI
uniref:Ig-like domain-containing protein n=1 Tax=Strongyloides venezuelensis TaxID=75913 RepID=A0A0K0FD84_STRVS